MIFCHNTVLICFVTDLQELVQVVSFLTVINVLFCEISWVRFEPLRFDRFLTDGPDHDLVAGGNSIAYTVWSVQSFSNACVPRGRQHRGSKSTGMFQDTTTIAFITYTTTAFVESSGLIDASSRPKSANSISWEHRRRSKTSARTLSRYVNLFMNSLSQSLVRSRLTRKEKNGWLLQARKKKL